MNKVLDIIKYVQSYDKHGDIKALFTEGYCYEFAKMLFNNIPNGDIVFIANKRHYVFCYKDKFYDITGEYKLDNGDVIERGQV